MATNTKIEWCNHTVNLWWGCNKVHTGCKNCYAQHLSDVRYKNGLWGTPYRKRIKSAFNDLDKYQKQAEKSNIKLKIFVGSMMDIFEDDKPLTNPAYIYNKYHDKHDVLNTATLRHLLFRRIDLGLYPNLIFLFLTKRPENIKTNVPKKWLHKAPKNVWFGTSISNQETANIYTNRLREYKNSNLFLSIEPQVGDIWCIDLTYISWVIQGGESGHNKRPFEMQWAYDMKRICQEQKTPYFFKQIDKVQPIPDDLNIKQYPDFN